MNNYIHPLQQQALQQPTVNPGAKKAAGTSFKAILKEATSEDTHLKVSKHAKARLQERNIHIHDEEWQAIGEKMNEAKSKGITDALVLTEQAALVVSTKNNTVVTALQQEEAENKIFTNINGTIFI